MASDGMLIVDKPQGWTSHDVVKKTRNLLGGAKVGHTGTLDPIATGILVLLVGKATKMARYFENDDKRYLAEVTFGRSTDTFDSMGTTMSTGDPGSVDMTALRDVIASFEGISEQVPPMYSAVKVGGKKLYKLARAGLTVDRKPRKIVIKKIAADVSGYPKITLDIECSKGTYIRTIAHQLGERVGCPAHLSALRRTASGNYTLRDAIDFLTVVNSEEKCNLKQHIIPISNMETAP